MGSPRVTVCQVTMVSLASSLTVALLISALSASPVPESSVKSVVTIFKQLAEVVKNTGDVITKIARNKTENQNILQAGEFLSGQGSYGADELPKDLSDLVQDNFQMLVEAIPAIKGNITNILDKIPAVKEMIVDRVQSIPPRSEIKENLKSVFDSLPDHDYVDAVEDHLGEQIDMIPSNDDLLDSLDSALENIPEDDYLHSKVDELVDSISPIVEDLNDTEAA